MPKITELTSSTFLSSSDLLVVARYTGSAYDNFRTSLKYISGSMNLHGTLTANGVTVNSLYSSSIYIGLRNDNQTGSGTALDPYDGSTGDKFDTVLRSYWLANSQSLDINLLPGTYYTRGGYDYYGSAYANGAVNNILNHGWRLKPNWRVQGAGVDITILKLTGSADVLSVHSSYGGNVTGSYQVYAIHTDFSIVNHGNEVSNLTVDCNYLEISASFAAAGRTSGVVVGAINLAGYSNYIHDVKVINSAAGSHMFNPGGMVAITTVASYDGDLTSLRTTHANWIDNVEIYPLAPQSTSSVYGILTASCDCVAIYHDNYYQQSGNVQTAETGSTNGFISNCYIECPTVDNHLRSIGAQGLSGGSISDNILQNSWYAINIDGLRNKNISITNNKLQGTHGYGIFLRGWSTSSADIHGLGNILVAGNLFEQRSSTSAVTVAGINPNNIIVTDNTFLQSGSGQSNIYAFTFNNDGSQLGSANNVTNITFDGNYIDTSVYSTLNSSFTASSMVNTDYSILNKNYVSGSLTIQHGNATINGLMSSSNATVTGLVSSSNAKITNYEFISSSASNLPLGNQLFRYKFGPSEQDSNYPRFLRYTNTRTNNDDSGPASGFLIFMTARDDDANARVINEMWHLGVNKVYQGAWTYDAHRVSGTNIVRAFEITNSAALPIGVGTAQLELEFWLTPTSGSGLYDDNIEVTVMEVLAGANSINAAALHDGVFSVNHITASHSGSNGYTTFELQRGGNIQSIIPISQSITANTGSSYFNSSTNALYVYNGTAWKSVTLT